MIIGDKINVSASSGNSHLERISKFVARIVEGRYPDLDEHHRRLGESALAFAKYLGCSAEETELLSVGARIHDIGKLSISEHILNKSARLTTAEFSLVKQHPEIGFQLLSPLGLDPRISEIVQFHHENFDGSGYPQGLTGGAIPLLARMTRIWDSFDALTMDRPYHKGVSREEALRLLQRDAQLYDPELLKEFCTMVSSEC